MSIIVTIIVFLVAIFIVVLIHEFGHFIVAKKSGIKVEEFAIGFPPKLYSKRYKGTKYSINWFPVGGYVKLFGEDDSDLIKEGSFQNASTFKRLMVVLAGPAFNVFLSVVIFSVVLFAGVQTVVTPDNKDNTTETALVLKSVVPGGPLDGKIPPNSIISHAIFYNEVIEIKSLTDLTSPLADERLENVILGYINEGEKGETVIELENGLLGGYFSNLGELKYPLHESIYRSIEYTFVLSGRIGVAIFDLIVDSIKGDANYENLSGPVGIASYAGDALSNGFSPYFMFIGILSLNLALINLVPLPALDGGRAVFVIYEMITKKRMPKTFEKVLNIIGFSFLILLLIIVTIKDIFSFF